MFLRYTEGDIEHSMVECSCGAVDHAIKFYYFNDDDANWFPDMHLGVYMPEVSFFKRIIISLSYIFRRKKFYKYAGNTEIMISVGDMIELKSFFKDFVEERSNRQLKLAISSDKYKRKLS